MLEPSLTTQLMMGIALDITITSGIALGLFRAQRYVRPILTSVVSGLLISLLLFLVSIWILRRPDPVHDDLPVMAAYAFVILAAFALPINVVVSAIAVFIARRSHTKKQAVA